MSLLKAVVGLGANLGDPLRTFNACLVPLQSTGRLINLSPVYRSAPIGGPPQPSFLNAAVLLESQSSPWKVLEQLKTIEDEFGRERMVHWGPRTLDLDLLWVDGVCCADPELTLPHPRLHERAFALQPLLDLLPEALEPRTLQRYSGLIEPLAGQVLDLSALGFGPPWHWKAIGLGSRKTISPPVSIL